MTAEETRAALAPVDVKAQLDRWFRAGVFAILLLVLLVGTVRAYFSIERAITVWLEPRYVPLGQAAFSIAMVALAAWLIRSVVIARAR